MSVLLEVMKPNVSNKEESTVGEILSELGIERPEDYVIAVDGEVVYDLNEEVAKDSRILVVPVVIGG